MPRNIERDKREADRRKNQLIEAGFRLFSQNGIETVSLQKVADAANVSPATMYKYFLTKEKLLIQTVFFLESNNSLIALIQRIDLVLINPVVNHNGLRNFLSLETVLYRLHQITADCDHKVTALAAELVEPHHGIGDELTLSVADSQHLLRVKVLNVINVLCVFYPLAPNAQ